MSLKPRKINFDTVWTSIKETIEGVMTFSNVPKNIWNDRFLDIYTICTAIPDPLCDELYQATKDFLENHVKKLYQKLAILEDDILLSHYHHHWLDYSKGATYLNQLYGYLNTQYIKKQKYKEADIKYGRLFVDLYPTSEHVMLLEIGDLALATWKNNMIVPLTERARTLLLAAISKDRNGEAVNAMLIRDVIQSLVTVEQNTKHPRQLYESLFEVAYLENTSDFYKKYSNQLLSQDKLACSLYMQKVVTKLSEEARRNRNIVDTNTLPKAENVCQKRLVVDVLPFLHSASKEMIRLEMVKDLSLMYSLLNPIQDSLSTLIDTLGEHITEVCMDKILRLEQENDPALFVESILAIHEKYKNLIASTFDSDSRFFASLDKACTYAINYKPDGRPHCRSPEQLSRYCDILLKKSSRTLSEAEVEMKLTNSVIIFSYLKDKDIFQQFYATMLAKRLIFGSSQSLDAEENMINKLKRACGYDFTNKLLRMFTDIRLSKDHNEGFQTYVKRNSGTTSPNLVLPNFSVYILQAGAWPINQANLPSFQTPVLLEKCLALFEQYYASKFNGRKLMWLYHLSMGEMKLTYLSKPYFLSLNTFQMAILLLYNNSVDPSHLPQQQQHSVASTSSTATHHPQQTSGEAVPPNLTYDHIQRETGLADVELRRHLLSLTDFGILNMYRLNVDSGELIPFSRSVQAGGKNAERQQLSESLDSALIENFEKGIFGLNMDFQSKKSKLKLTIPSVITKEQTATQAQESQQTHHEIEEDRKMYLQAVIVRVMKARKVIQHNPLVQEVIEQSKARFVPSVTMIKKCIEALIEKQYMKRKPDSPEEYSYMA